MAAAMGKGPDTFQMQARISLLRPLEPIDAFACRLRGTYLPKFASTGGGEGKQAFA